LIKFELKYNWTKIQKEFNGAEKLILFERLMKNLIFSTIIQCIKNWSQKDTNKRSLAINSLKLTDFILFIFWRCSKDNKIRVNGK
jgi:hypothetical protein